MTLKETISKANELILENRPLKTEELLKSGAELIYDEKDLRILLTYAKLCNHWGDTDSEEIVLRYILTFELSRPDLLRSLHTLLFLITRERLIDAIGNEKTELINECIQISSRAIDLLSDLHGADWANLLNARAERYLDLARMGELDAANLAYNDFNTFINWIEKGSNIPTHWNREIFLARAQINLAETNIFNKNDLQGTILLLESAIQTLESNCVAEWATERAYELLGKAEASASQDQAAGRGRTKRMY